MKGLVDDIVVVEADGPDIAGTAAKAAVVALVSSLAVDMPIDVLGKQTVEAVQNLDWARDPAAFAYAAADSAVDMAAADSYNGSRDAAAFVAAAADTDTAGNDTAASSGSFVVLAILAG